MAKWVWSLALVIVAMTAVGCSTRAAGHDAGPLIDAAPAPFDGGPGRMDAGSASYAEVRVVNLVPIAPTDTQLTLCISTITGTGVPETPGEMLGLIPYPAVSPYLNLPYSTNPGFGYVMRLYDPTAVPFTMFARCPAPGAVAPVVEVHVDGSQISTSHPSSVVMIGVIPNSPVQCPGACPPPQARVIADDRTLPTGPRVRTRLFQGVPNLPAPIDVCFDFDYQVVMGTVMDGPIPPSRVLPPLADTDGLAFGEVTDFIEIPAVTTRGAFYTHAHVAGVPDCDPSTLLLGPITVPLPVPADAPVDVARVFARGDVITSFAFGRAGAACTMDSDCVAPNAVECSATTPCTCDHTHHCTDALAGSLLPWRDVRGDAPVDAGTPSVDAGGGNG
jgi:hypothetical protein